MLKTPLDYTRFLRYNVGEERSVNPTMDHEYEADLLTLLDDEGQEHEFEIIDELENDDGHFLALVPTQQEADELVSDAETYYIFEVIEEDGEEQLQEVEDDELLDKLAAIFEERFNEAYFDEDEE